MKRHGRGATRTGEPVNWRLAEKLYLHGGTRGDDGRTVHMSLEAIGERAGCSKQAVSQRAKQFGWERKREEIEQGERAQSVRDALVSGKRPTLTPGAVLDVYLAHFEDAVLAGRVRFDSLPDFERAVNLKRRLEAEDRVATERQGVVSLDQLRARHRARADEEAGITDASAGVLAHGSVGMHEEPGEASDPEASSAGMHEEQEPEGPARRRATTADSARKRQSKPAARGKPSGKQGKR